MLTIDNIAWEVQHGGGAYTARVSFLTPWRLVCWFDVTKDNGRGLARKWKAERTSAIHRDGMPPLTELVGYGRTRVGAIRDAVENATKV